MRPRVVGPRTGYRVVKPPAWDSKTKTAALAFVVAVGAELLRYLDGLIDVWLKIDR